MSGQAWFLVTYVVVGLTIAIKMTLDETKPSRSGPGKPFAIGIVVTFFMIWPLIASAYIALAIYIIMERRT